MKKLISIFVLSLLLLSACVTTNVYPGEKDGRTYQSQNTRVCETLKFECDEYEIPFSDYTGCGCELIEALIDEEPPLSGEDLVEDEDEGTEEEAVEPPLSGTPSEDLVDEPIEDENLPECGIYEEGQIDCDEGMMCGILEDETEPKCLSENICDDLCEEGVDCVIMESYPVRVRCVNPEEPTGDELVEEPVDDEEEAMDQGETTAPSEESVEDGVEESSDDGSEEEDE
ncbi:hypothetical protein KJ742_05675 [Patescibacteria group bacterium]|nr:hypothetical protein [Patescibacteria group bacterium]MBU1683406.1 hypothetical protein [Patescibacteria group bacterium]MBU1934792.1 hypothetical protein [Patescibacteria group bacterium]